MNQKRSFGLVCEAYSERISRVSEGEIICSIFAQYVRWLNLPMTLKMVYRGPSESKAIIRVQVCEEYGKRKPRQSENEDRAVGSNL